MNGKTLNMVQSAQLVNLLMQEYESKMLSDADFAKYATAKLGCTITAGHVSNRRSALGFKSPLSTPLSRLFEQVQILEEKVQRLEQKVLVNELLKA